MSPCRSVFNTIVTVWRLLSSQSFTIRHWSLSSMWNWRDRVWFIFFDHFGKRFPGLILLSRTLTTLGSQYTSCRLNIYDLFQSLFCWWIGILKSSSSTSWSSRLLSINFFGFLFDLARIRTVSPSSNRSSGFVHFGLLFLWIRIHASSSSGHRSRSLLFLDIYSFFANRICFKVYRPSWHRFSTLRFCKSSTLWLLESTLWLYPLFRYLHILRSYLRLCSFFSRFHLLHILS